MMAKTRKQKEDIVHNLEEKLQKAKSVVFADYRGLTMKQLSELRSKLRNLNAEFSITQNTLLARALPKSDIRLPASELKGPTATLFAYDDEITPIKTLVKTLKEATIGKVKAGFLGLKFLDALSISALAALPSKPELQGQVIGTLVAPIHGIVGVLSANLRNLVYTLEQIRIQKGGE